MRRPRPSEGRGYQSDGPEVGDTPWLGSKSGSVLLVRLSERGHDERHAP